MFNQHAKWLKVTCELAMATENRFVNYLLHPMFGNKIITALHIRILVFLTTSSTKKADVVRVYLPP